jgi:putative tryptophan/tyrosine transport system substrate-binding protein
MPQPRSIGTALALALIVGVGGTGVLSVASAQPGVQPARVGFLSPAGAAEYAGAADAFRQGLSDRGYIENKNLRTEYRWAAGKAARLPAFALELVRLRVDVIVAHGLAAGLAAKEATATIPIVMVGTVDPVRAGLVSSLARPGGNVTGLAYPESADELSGKWIQLVIELVPKLSRLAVLTNSDNSSHGRRLKNIEAAGRTLRVDVHGVEMRELDLERALTSLVQLNAGALIVLPDPVFTNQRQRLAAFALEKRQPAVYMFREFPEAGGLLSYGPNLQASFREAAVYVGKILKGAKPADLPVEQPTKFELVINARTAKTLGLTIPPSLLLRVDQVLE